MQRAYFVVKAEAKCAVREEGIDPVHQKGVEAPIEEDDPESVFANVVEEPRDIKEQSTSAPVDLVCQGNMVSESECGVEAARASPRPELIGWEDLHSIDGMGDAFGHSFLHKLAEAVQQRDGAIRLQGEVVGFPQLGDHMHQGVLPKGWVEGMG